MKKIFLVFVVLFSISCSEDDDKTPTTPIVDSFNPMEAGVMLLKEGTLASSAHTVSGTVKIYDDAGKKVMVLDPFSSENGPDLKVYLSTDQKATEYINLGALKSTTGKQSYVVTGMPDLDQYKYVLIWCQQYSVLFGKSELQ